MLIFYIHLMQNKKLQKVMIKSGDQKLLSKIEK